VTGPSTGRHAAGGGIEDADRRARLAVMLSGSGRTLEYLAEDAEAGRIPAEIALVIASRPCRGLERAEGRGIPTILRPGPIPARELEALLREHRIDWVALAGYLHLVDIPPSYEGRVVNIHPALLPAHGGPGMYGDRVHQAVLASGATESGCTVHLCDAAYDRGPIVVQRRCAVEPADTVRTLADRVFALEREAYPEALRMLMRGEWTPEQSRDS